MDIYSPELDELLNQIEVERRRKIIDYKSGSDFKYYDTDGNISKLKIYNNNIIEARRGCGKTSLILKTLRDNNDIAVKCDCQSFRAETEENIVLKLLTAIATEIRDENIHQYNELMQEYNQNTEGLLGFFKAHFNKELKELKFRLDSLMTYRQHITEVSDLIQQVCDMPEERTITYSSSNKNSTHNKSETVHRKNRNMNVSAGLTYANDYVDLASKLAAERDKLSSFEASNTNEAEETSSNTYTKKILRRNEVIALKGIMEELLVSSKKIHNKGTTLFLDDFYQIERNSHPFVIQYLHDLYKNTPQNTFCFKLVSLPSSLMINKKNETTFSLKDDFSQIRLDYDLSELDKVQEHLIDTLVALDKTGKWDRISITHLFSNDEAIKYLAIATGGIPRDFMTSFGDAVKIARKARRVNISKDNIYSVIKNIREEKQKNYEADSDLPEEKIEKAVEIIANSIVSSLNTSVILYPQEKATQHDILLKNLVNLRYLHLIKDNITSKKTEGKCKAYLVDMTFYAYSRLKTDFGFCKFWERTPNGTLENLRNAKVWSFDDKDYDDIVGNKGA